jgi:glycosyltransferase involved in cell wall biosynthesis
LALEGRGGVISSATYKIGAWPWELPHWPTAFNGIVNLVDEIWVPTSFVLQSFLPLKALAPIDIHHVPPPVEIPMPTANVRVEYGLPPGDFLFYVLFDGNSWLSRKNPLAGVHAFQKAFSAREIGVGLVIKAMNIRSGNPMWEEVMRIAAKDSRIYILTETLSRQAVINFMSSCNAYVSLHRSEGFGRVIAEAMLLGQPTVTTNFSGNVDFCTDQTSFLVGGEFRSLAVEDYIFSDGQYWCDPDIDTAALRMREVLEDTAKRETLAAAGKKLIKSRYSVAAVSADYHVRLSALFAKLGVS